MSNNRYDNEFDILSFEKVEDTFVNEDVWVTSKDVAYSSYGTYSVWQGDYDFIWWAECYLGDSIHVTYTRNEGFPNKEMAKAWCISIMLAYAEHEIRIKGYMSEPIGDFHVVGHHLERATSKGVVTLDYDSNAFHIEGENKRWSITDSNLERLLTAYMYPNIGESYESAIDFYEQEFGSPISFFRDIVCECLRHAVTDSNYWLEGILSHDGMDITSDCVSQNNYAVEDALEEGGIIVITKTGRVRLSKETVLERLGKVDLDMLISIMDDDEDIGYCSRKSSILHYVVCHEHYDI